MGKSDLKLSRDACELLHRHAWPGNIRELQNAIERSLITSEGTLVTAAHLALPVPAGDPSLPEAPASAIPAASLEAVERAAILDALQQTHGHITRAAARLGLTRYQLSRRMKRYGIEGVPD